LCCLFMKPQGIDKNIVQLNKVASRIITEMENIEEENPPSEESDEDTVEEVKRLIVNLLSETEMSTPELRRYFKLSNSQIWKIISDLENSNKVKRTSRKGRAVYWTAI